MKRPKQRVEAVRVDVLNNKLAKVHLRGIGHRAVCGCGWRSRILRDRRAARAELHAHNAALHAEARLSLSGPL